MLTTLTVRVFLGANEDILNRFNDAKSLYNDGNYANSNAILLDLLKSFDDTSIHSMVSLNYLCLKEHELAFKFINLALLQKPNDSFVNYILGSIYFEINNIAESINCYKKSIQHSPKDINVHNSMAKCYDTLNDVPNLKKHLLISLSIDNSQVGVIKKLAYIEGKEENYLKSIQYYRYALNLKDSPDIYHLLGLAYNHINEYAKGIYYFHKSLNDLEVSDKSIYRICYYNLGISYHKLGYFDRAKKSYLHVLSLDSNDARANWSLSVLYLLMGDFKNGWKKYEWRKKLPLFKSRTHGLLKEVPQYIGQDISDKILSIHSEQGYGDTIQFSIMINFLLKTTNLKKIIFRTHSALYETMKQFNSSRCEVYPEGYKYVENIRADYQIALMSIPAYFSFSFFDIDRKPYLFANNTVALPLDFNKLNIGIAWSGNSDNANNYLRSIKLDLFEDILKNENIKFYSLHLKEANQDISKFGYEDVIVDLSSKMNDFSHTASIISQLDLVISVDTVIAHLAGALGVRAFVLLQYAPDFRWLLNRDDSLWYESLKLFRQEKFGDYSKPIENIKLEIDEMIEGRKEALSS